MRVQLKTRRVKLRSKRVRLLYRPHFAGSIQGHAINQCRSFYPKLHSQHEFDDLLQEANIIFLKCQRRYSTTPGMNDAWFMSLFSRALTNKLIRMSTLVARYNYADSKVEPVSDTENAGMLSIMLQELPHDMKELLRAMTLPDTNERAWRKRYAKTIRRILEGGLASASLLLKR